MLLGKNEDFWCGSLNYSCIIDVPPINGNLEKEKILSLFVWFENPGRSLRNYIMKENILHENYRFHAVTDTEFVWFEEGHKESKETNKSKENTLKPSYDILTDGQNQQLKEVLEANPTLFK